MGVETTDGNKSYKSIFNSTVAMEGLSPNVPIPPGYTIDRYSTGGILQETTTRTDLTTTETLTTAGYYVVTCSGPVTFDMWAWGGGGARGDGPGPGGGGAGGGVRGRKSFSTGDTLTILVAATADGIASGPVGAWPDGGGYTTPRYDGAGGGSSRIADGTIPYPTINDSPSTYLLIGGGGGGGSDYLTSGTYGGQGGYPSGQPGGAYYPADGQKYGGGGTQSAGGAAGPAGRRPAGVAGSKYAGGRGGNTDGGGGGGGGYYGGGGAGGYYAHGGGGSSYIDPAEVTNSASFNASPGSTTHNLAVDDPANPGIKPASGGDRDSGGVVVLKPVT